MRPWVLLVGALLLAGCAAPTPSPTQATSSPGTPTPTSSTPATTPGPGPFPPLMRGPAFNATAAFADVRAQVIAANGTTRHRVPGTAGNEEAAQIIVDNLGAAGWNVTWDGWNASYLCAPTSLHNVIGQRNGTSGKTVILGAHYDTRPIAESDANATNRTMPIPGANDGGSGVGVLLELARALGPTNDTVRLIFFDAEDSGDVPGSCGTDWLMGSRHYAENMTQADRNATKSMVLVDLVGDPNLTLPRELSTYENAQNPGGRPVQDRIYAIGDSLGYAQFSNESRAGMTWSIEDDHAPFYEVGIPAVDLIALVPTPAAFPEWHHTQHDDMAHVSAASLGAVGRTLQVWLEEGAQTGP